MSSYLADHPEIRQEIKRFYEALAIMDQQAGEFLEALEASGQADNTNVIYLTDHGRGLWREKRWPYDAGIYLSLAIRGPGIEPRTVSKELVSWVDLAETSEGDLIKEGVLQDQLPSFYDRAKPLPDRYALGEEGWRETIMERPRKQTAFAATGETWVFQRVFCRIHRFLSATPSPPGD